MSVSTEHLYARDRRHLPPALDAAAPAEAVLEAPDVARIAQGLAEKYGVDALSLARDRARRAAEVDDTLAFEAWGSVIAALRAMLRPAAEA